MRTLIYLLVGCLMVIGADKPVVEDEVIFRSAFPTNYSRSISQLEIPITYVWHGTNVYQTQIKNYLSTNWINYAESGQQLGLVKTNTILTIINFIESKTNEIVLMSANTGEIVWKQQTVPESATWTFDNNIIIPFTKPYNFIVK